MRRAIPACRCRATSTAPSAAIRAASSSAIGPPSTPSLAEVKASGAAARPCGGRRSTASVVRHASGRCSARSTAPRSSADVGRSRRRDGRPRDGGGARGLSRLERDAGRAPRRRARARRRPHRGAARPAHPPPAGRGRQDPRRRRLRGARGGRLLPLLRGAGARRCSATAKRLPGPTGEANVLRLRGRGVFVAISPWNFPLAIFLGQVDGGARGRQQRRRQAGRADAARSPPRPCASCTRPAFRPRPCISCRATDASAPRLVAHPDVAGVVFTGSTEVARQINRDARREGRADRAADRRDGRHQRHDRRRDGPARAGRRRRRHLGLPLGRPALLGPAAPLRAGGRRRPHDRDDRRARRAS